ncbi:hypothetical protein KP509_34G019200 [Ceratopteris richardii]|uniref:CRM domain-containing protein n=1 Tax=Ceratopteris richardii TaxID=49495 RepID=A0A8T2QJB8_CERRI|nr:hypothetical protein KP509_34G019200 [Ceratopteris richardii]
MSGVATIGVRNASLWSWTWSNLSVNAAAVTGSSVNFLFSQPCVRYPLSRGSAGFSRVSPAVSSSPHPCIPSLLQASLSDSRASAEDAPISVPRKFPALSPKEKKELRAYAHSLGKKIVTQQIGKAGVTESLAKAISDALEAKEILKLKVLDNCPDELDEVIEKIEEATQGQVVGRIGSVITLYRPSLRKLSEAERLQKKAEDGSLHRKPIGRRA